MILIRAVDGLAACPICWARMKPWQVDKHIDTSCPGSPQPTVATSRISSSRTMSGFSSGHAVKSSIAANPLERLPPLNYSILRDQALRKKMSELNISASGSRQLLERRHKEWVTIWNANCDSARPKSRMELLHDLDVWERTLGGRAPLTLSSHIGAQIRDKDFDGAAWAAKHDTSFKDLIANARRSRNQPAAKQPEGPEAGQASGEEGGAGTLHFGTDAAIDLTGSPSRSTGLVATGVVQEQDILHPACSSANQRPPESQQFFSLGTPALPPELPPEPQFLAAKWGDSEQDLQ